MLLLLSEILWAIYTVAGKLIFILVRTLKNECDPVWHRSLTPIRGLPYCSAIDLLFINEPHKAAASTIRQTGSIYLSLVIIIINTLLV